MPSIILKPDTIKLLLNFSQNISEQGLVGELPSQERADERQMSTYIDATVLYDAIQTMKKDDASEWDKLRQCRLRNWADPRTNNEGDTFESCFDGVFNNLQCVSAFKATTARFLFEQVEAAGILDEKVKDGLRFQCVNSYVDIHWKVQAQASVVMPDVKPLLKKAPSVRLFDNTLSVNLSDYKADVKKISKNSLIHK